MVFSYFKKCWCQWWLQPMSDFNYQPWSTILNTTTYKQVACPLSIPCLWPYCFPPLTYLMSSSSGKYAWQISTILRGLSSFQQTRARCVFCSVTELCSSLTYSILHFIKSILLYNSVQIIFCMFYSVIPISYLCLIYWTGTLKYTSSQIPIVQYTGMCRKSCWIIGWIFT